MVTAVVTGATGFIGSALCEALVLQGHRVRGTVRSASSMRARQLHEAVAKAASQHCTAQAGQAAKPGSLELVEADMLSPPEALEAVLEGCEVLFHVASPFAIEVQDPQRELIQPAVEGTRNILTAAARLKSRSLRRVVLTSSMAAVHDCHQTQEPKWADGAYTEEDWNEASTVEGSPQGPPEAYWVSKVRAEREAWRIAQEQGLELATVLPSFVLGPVVTLAGAETSLSAGFLKGFIEAQPGDEPPSWSGQISDVRDVVQAHIQAGLAPGAAGRRYIVSASEPISSRDITDAIKAALPGAFILDGQPLPSGGTSPGRRVDSSRVQRELGVALHAPQQTIGDMARSLVALGYARTTPVGAAA